MDGLRGHPDYTQRVGGVAQLGERQLCKLDVVGSIPSTSTKFELGMCISGFMCLTTSVKQALRV